jgi:hypothetical protein
MIEIKLVTPKNHTRASSGCLGRSVREAEMRADWCTWPTRRAGKMIQMHHFIRPHIHATKGTAGMGLNVGGEQ